MNSKRAKTKSQLIVLGHQYQFDFKKSRRADEIEYHVRRCLSKGLEPVEWTGIKPRKREKIRDLDYYKYLIELSKANGFVCKYLPKMNEMINFLKENKIQFQVQYKFMRRDFRTYKECTTNYQLLLFRAKELGYEKRTKGRPSSESLNEWIGAHTHGLFTPDTPVQQ